MKQVLHILHIEDSETDSLLVESTLQASGFQVELERVEDRPGLLKALQNSSFDLVLSDCALPQFSGLQALEIVHALKPRIPFIFISGTIGEEAAIECLHRGASDYVLKDRPARLVSAISRAIELAEERAQREAMEIQLRQSRKLEAIGRVAGGIAHDFNNLLQIFKIQVAMLDLMAEHPERVRKTCKLLERATDNATEMTAELLLFARKSEVQLMSVNVTERLRDTVELLRTGLPDKVTLNFTCEESLPTVFVDPPKLDRILTNLIMNAKDAMPSGGEITISSDVVHFEPPILNFSQGDDVLYLRVKVTDTGTGMDEFTQKHAFEPFFTSKPAGKGTGLGLAVVFGLMQVHNGFVDLQSEVGKGTSVSLFFPLPHDATTQSTKFKAISPIRTSLAA